MNSRERALVQSLQASAPREALEAYAKAVHASQKVNTEKFFFSRVRFQYAVAGNVLTLAAQGAKILAFNYGAGDSMASAGFPAGTIATESDTNLKTRGERPNPSATIKIFGISFVLSPQSDGILVPKVFDSVSCDVTVDGTNQHRLIGPLSFIPAAAGLVGGLPTRLLAPALNASAAPTVEYGSNGVASNRNFLSFGKDPIIWRPTNQADSRFQVRFGIDKTTSHTRPADRVAAAGVDAYTGPAALGDLGTFVDLIVRLHTSEMGDRSSQVG